MYSIYLFTSECIAGNAISYIKSLEVPYSEELDTDEKPNEKTYP